MEKHEERIAGRTIARPASSLVEPLWFALGICFVLAAMLVIVRTPFPPLQDFGEWVYQAYLFKLKLLNPHADLPFVVKHWPVPNMLSQSVMTSLMFVVRAVVAAKIFLCAYLALGAAALWRISRLHGGAHRNLLFFAMVPLLLVNTTFWTGEINYQIAMLVFASYVATPVSGRRRWGVVLGCSLLLVATHPLPYAFLVLFVLGDSLQVRASWKRLLALAPSGLLALWYIHADPRPDDATAFSPAVHGIAGWVGYRLYVFSKLGVYHNLVFDGAGDATRAHAFYVAGLVANVVVLAGTLTLLGAYLVRGARRKVWNPALMLVALCTVLAFFDPATLLRNANIGERLLMPALALALVGSASSARWQKGWYAFAGCAGLGFILVTAVHPPTYTPHEQKLENTAVNTEQGREHLLYWTRPYDFVDGERFASKYEANRASIRQAPELAFEMGILLRPKETARNLNKAQVQRLRHPV